MTGILVALMFLVLILWALRPELGRLLTLSLGILVLVLLGLWAFFLRLYINLAELVIIALMSLILYLLSLRSR